MRSTQNRKLKCYRDESGKIFDQRKIRLASNVHWPIRNHEVPHSEKSECRSRRSKHECHNAQSRALHPDYRVDAVNGKRREYLLDPDALGNQFRRRCFQRIVVVIHHMEYLVHGYRGQCLS